MSHFLQWSEYAYRAVLLMAAQPGSADCHPAGCDWRAWEHKRNTLPSVVFYTKFSHQKTAASNITCMLVLASQSSARSKHRKHLFSSALINNVIPFGILIFPTIHCLFKSCCSTLIICQVHYMLYAGFRETSLHPFST